MKLSDLTKEELENMSYDDLAYGILSESKTDLQYLKNELEKRNRRQNSRFL